MCKHSKAFPSVLESLESAGLEVLVFSDVEADPGVETVDRGARMMREFALTRRLRAAAEALWTAPRPFA
jgi:alcohol dehydrogenase class IV